jgi:hypothetical protein
MPAKAFRIGLFRPVVIVRETVPQPLASSQLRRFEAAREALNHVIALVNSLAEVRLIRRELDNLAK